MIWVTAPMLDLISCYWNWSIVSANNDSDLTMEWSPTYFFELGLSSMGFGLWILGNFAD